VLSQHPLFAFLTVPPEFSLQSPATMLSVRTLILLAIGHTITFNDCSLISWLHCVCQGQPPLHGYSA